MTDGVVAFSRDGSVIQSNPAAEEMLGRSIPIGGSENYDTLFSDIAPRVLAASASAHTDGERMAAAAWSFCSPPLTRSVWAAFLSSFTT